EVLHAVPAGGPVGEVPPPEAADESAPVAGVAQLRGQGAPGLPVAVQHVGGGGGEVVGVPPALVDGLAPGDLGGDVVDRAVVGRGHDDLEPGQLGAEPGEGEPAPGGIPAGPVGEGGP